MFQLIDVFCQVLRWATVLTFSLLAPITSARWCIREGHYRSFELFTLLRSQLSQSVLPVRGLRHAGNSRSSDGLQSSANSSCQSTGSHISHTLSATQLSCNAAREGWRGTVANTRTCISFGGDSGGAAVSEACKPPDTTVRWQRD